MPSWTSRGKLRLDLSKPLMRSPHSNPIWKPLTLKLRDTGAAFFKVSEGSDDNVE